MPKRQKKLLRIMHKRIPLLDKFILYRIDIRENNIT